MRTFAPLRSGQSKTDPERENEQDAAPVQEEDYEGQDIKNTNEDSSEAVVAEEETEPELVEPSEEEKTVSEDATNGVVESGTCGDSLIWTLDDAGTLTISGTGEMTSSPWLDYADDITQVVIENGVTSIGASAFEWCYMMESVTIPESVTSIGNSAFYECSSLTIVPIPESVTRIGGYAFASCSSLRTVIIPKGVTRIGNYAFEYCNRLTNVTIRGGVTRIGDYAFYDCHSLTSVTIPESVTQIGKYAFYGCSDLEDVYYSGSKKGWTSISIEDGNENLTDASFHNSIEEVVSGEDEDDLSWTLDDAGTLTISGTGEMTSSPWLKDYADDITKVVIENGVTSIGASAFEWCYMMESVTIPESVTTIGNSAFYECSSLTNVMIPESVTRIGGYAFASCSSLRTVIIPKSVTRIGNYAFEYCDRLTNVTIQDGVKRIGDYSFYDCHSLTSVTIPESVTQIGKYAFYGCSDLEDVIYSGSKKGWTSISIEDGNEKITDASLYCAIEVLNIADASITGLVDMDYTGKAITQTPVVTLRDTTLIEDTDYRVLYSNNINAGIATVTINGIGNYYDGKTSATFKINKISQSITASNLSLVFPKTGTITASGNKGTLSYKSSNTDVATVDSTGKVTPKGVGKATITIIASATSNYKAATKTITVTVTKGTQSITAKSTAASVAVGKTATVSITGARGTKSFKSSDTTIATVTSAGKVTAKKVGTVKITATSAATTNYKAASKTVKIMVVPAATTSLTAANQATGIKLTWKKVTGANGYKVYRGSTLVKTITSGSTVTFTDTKANTNGTKYTFKIVAKAATGDSTLSKSVIAYRVARPAISSATNSAAGKMTIKWDKNAKATGYQLQYSNSKTFASGNKAVSVTSASTVSKIITGLTKGNTYYVRIRTYKTIGSTKYWSVWSVAKSVKISK